MEISQTQAELRLAQSIQSRCDLKHIALLKCNLQGHGDESEFKAPFGLKFSHECSGSMEERWLLIVAEFKFECTDASDEPRSLFDLACSFELQYELQGDYQPGPEEIDAFKKGNAVFNCWPYVREFVQNTTARMGFQPPPIPLLRIKPKQESQKPKQRQPTKENAEVPASKT